MMGLFSKVFNTPIRFCQLRAAKEVYFSRRLLWRGYNSTPTTEENELEEKITVKQPRHIPVMLNEVMNVLQPRERGTIVDMTFGAGGHIREIIRRAPDTKVFVLDRDPVAFEMAKTLCMECRQGQVTPLLGRFSELPHLFRANGVKEESLDAFLFDLGASSMQFDESERGFSLSRDGPLDMRMDGGRRINQPTAADVVNDLDESDLHDIIKKYGEEKLARKIARAIVETRYAFGKITRTQQLADIISSVFSGDHKQDKMMRHSNVATKTFQALRIFVNNELNELNNGLEVAHRYLKPGGICVTISFHSLEDRIVKRHFHGIEMDSKLNMNVRDHHRNSLHIHSKQQVLEMLKQRWQPMSKKVSVPEYMDTVANPRARSAKLRAAIRL